MISVRSEVQVFPGPPSFARASERKDVTPKPILGIGGLGGASFGSASQPGIDDRSLD